MKTHEILMLVFGMTYDFCDLLNVKQN